MPLVSTLLLSLLIACSGNKEVREATNEDPTSKMDTARSPATPGAIPSNGVPDATGRDSSAAQAHDDDIFNQRIEAARQYAFAPLPIGERIAAFGRLFIGTPYVAGTLDIDSTNEHLITNLRGLDCVTFYENALALARLIRKGDPTFDSYKKELEFLRYRDGKLNGYASRLHYTVDYFRNAEKKGILKDVTKDVGGSSAKLDSRKIDFMSTHRTSYRQLAHDDAQFARIKEMEDRLNAQKGYYYIPKDRIASVEQKIQTGDILGITTNIDGLDCSHTGIAVRTEDGRIHFMHASSLQHKVILADEPLADYLSHSTRQTGIIITRPTEITREK